MVEYEQAMQSALVSFVNRLGMPCTQSVLLFRPIKSRDRYVQAVGRVSRPAMHPPNNQVMC
jgi:superfamily II DNA or RNA helicase